MAGLKNKRILVTGGTGFIGGHLVSELASQGANVLVIDIAVHENSIYSRSGLFKKTKFELVDVRDEGEIGRIFDEFDPEYVVHLAAASTVEYSYDNPRKAIETNVMGTVNVLDASRRRENLKGVIVASSDKAYGKSDSRYTEEGPLRGDHPYDASKSSQDLISLSYSRTYGLPVVVTRFGNIYGEGDLHFDRIFPGICEAIVKGKTFEIRSNGKYIRDYLYVRDVVQGYLFLVSNFNRVKNKAFNFSSNENLSVLQVLKLAQKITGKKIKFHIRNTVKNEIPYQHLDDSKIRKLGWKTQYRIEQVFPRVLLWYKELLQ